MNPYRTIFVCMIVFAISAADVRDPRFRPFSAGSIWNTPLGDASTRVPAGFAPSSVTFIGVDLERIIQIPAGSPSREVRLPTSWQPRWPGTVTPSQGTMPVADALIIPDATAGNTPNECDAFLLPDGRTVVQLGATCRAVAAQQIVGFRSPNDQDIYGPGITGSHGGSGLSALGGSIRLGELVGTAPIGHVIKLNVWSHLYLFWSAAVPGYRWPAINADNYASTSYIGTNPHILMGTLLALPANVTPTSLGISHPVALKLYAAFHDYGAYIADDSAWDDFDLCAEFGVPDEVLNATGVSMTGRSGPLVDDIKLLVAALQVVDDNASNRIGGGGNRRVPYLPPFITVAGGPVAPVPVAGLLAVPDSSTVILTWTSQSGAVVYVIEGAAAANGPWSQAATTVNATWTATGLLSSSTSWWRVSVVNQSGLGSPSAAVSATTTISAASSNAASSNDSGHCGLGSGLVGLMLMLACWGRRLVLSQGRCRNPTPVNLKMADS